jgi:hypothetical protein
VTLTSVTSAAVAGTFSFTYDTGDTLSGAFDVPICSSVALSAFTSAATVACGQ